jgi:hypothetical protein
VANLFIGKKPGIGMVVKIMENDTYDPLTTPISDVAKFKFSSEISDYSYISKIHNFSNPSTFAPQQNIWYYLTYPDGSNTKYALRHTGSGGSDFVTALTYDIASQFGGFPPFMKFNNKNTATGVFEGPSTNRNIIGGAIGNGNRGGSENALLVNNTLISPTVPVNSLTSGLTGVSGWNCYTAITAGYSVSFTFFDLVGDGSTPTPDPAPSVSGDTVIINETVVKIAKANFTVDQLGFRTQIIDSNRSPALVLKSGDLTMTANQSVTITTPYALTDSTYIGLVVGVAGAPLLSPIMLTAVANSSPDVTGFNYQIVNGDLVFNNNNGFSVSVRYVISADDASLNVTSGGKNIIEEKTDSNGTYFRLKKPGSSDSNPSLNEVLLDTRLKALRIVSSGFIPRASFVASNNSLFGSKMFEINHPNSGSYKTFAVFNCLCADGSIRLPQTRHHIQSYNITGTANNHSVCRLEDEKTTFYISADGAATTTNNDGSQGTNSAVQVNGIIYYIFAIPN